MSSHAHWQGVLHLGLIFACVLVCEGGLLEFLTTLKHEGEAAIDGGQHPQGLIEFPALDEMNSEERESNRMRARKVATIIEKNVHMLANDMLQMWAIARTDTDDEADMDEELGEEEDEVHKEAGEEATSTGGEEQEGNTKGNIGQGMNGLALVAKSLLQDESNTVKDKGGNTEAVGARKDEEAKPTVEENQEKRALKVEKSSSLVKEDNNGGTKGNIGLGMNGLALVAKSLLQDESNTVKDKGGNAEAFGARKDEEAKPTLEEKQEKSALKAEKSNSLGKEDKNGRSEGPVDVNDKKGVDNLQAKKVKGNEGQSVEDSISNKPDERNLEKTEVKANTINGKNTKTNVEPMPGSEVKEKSVDAEKVSSNTVEAKKTEEAQIRVKEGRKEVKSVKDSKVNKLEETSIETPGAFKTNYNDGKETKTSLEPMPGNRGKEKSVDAEKVSSSTIEAKANEEAQLRVKEGKKGTNIVEQNTDSVARGNNKNPVLKKGNEVKSALKKLIDGSLNKRPLEKPKETRRGKYVISEDLVI